ncbi:substrate-binding domain-containing protein [Pedobacter sp. SD-b]|uniref:Substrate-binding domain-containing protein n=1 Tax=Pedobacter segetis TaxID=2793069 RepID=A0ABS1BFF0_9SPHI|nr:substrate-binding domain-containing protein [Pedobacter segetis]MBK0381565.1 substrate-binding domain-containing protein [Pedobacter segetis]
MIKKGFLPFVFMFSLLIMFACRQQTVSDNTDEITYGNATMVADESLYPIVDDEYQIFSNDYKRANINIIYKPLTDALDLFTSDSIDVAILPRKLSEKEAKSYLDKNIIIRYTKFAIDGIALITGKNNPDSLITVTELKDALSGNSKKNTPIVFDNPKSSTVEYLMSLTGVKTFPKNVYALKSNKEVIKYIVKNPNAIGIVSVAWMKRPTQDIAADVEKTRFIAVKGEGKTYEKPTQSNLKVDNYPLIRDLYIINCQGRAGLGTGFAAFVASELGQRIILKSGLAPDSLPSRQIKIRN